MSGFVYAVGDETGRVKIGWSGDPLRRLSKISSDCSSVVTLLGLVPATRRQEAEIQGLLSPWKINREWFKHEGPVETFVKMLPRPEPQIVRAETPAASIIQKLGGEAVVAKITGTASTAPYRWQYPRERGGTGGLIPQRYHRILLEHARASGIELSAEEFLPLAQDSQVAAE